MPGDNPKEARRRDADHAGTRDGRAPETFLEHSHPTRRDRRIARLEADGSRLSDTAWTVSTFFVTARSGRSRLEIRDEGMPNGLGSYIDDVRVVPVGR